MNLRYQARLRAAMAALGVALAIAPIAARADVIDFYLTTPEGGGTPITQSSAVEVIVTTTTGSAGDWTAATVEFVAPGTSTIDAPVLINVNGDFTATSTEGIAGKGEEDTFGQMSEETGSAGGHATVTIGLTAAGGNFWTSAANVLIPTCPNTESTPSAGCGGYGVSGGDSLGYSVAEYSHGFEATTAAQNAGYYVPAVVPEPASLALLSTALVGVGVVRRRKRKSA